MGRLDDFVKKIYFLLYSGVEGVGVGGSKWWDCGILWTDLCVVDLGLYVHPGKWNTAPTPTTTPLPNKKQNVEVVHSGMSNFREMLVIRKNRECRGMPMLLLRWSPPKGTILFFKYISVSCHLYRVTPRGQNRPEQAKTHGNVLLPFNRNRVFSGELILSEIQGKCDVSIGVPLVFGKFWQLWSEILHNHFVTCLNSRLAGKQNSDFKTISYWVVSYTTTVVILRQFHTE